MAADIVHIGLHPREKRGPRWRSTTRRPASRTVDGVKLVPFGRGYRVDGTVIGMEKGDDPHWTVVAAHLPDDHPDHTFLATRLDRAVAGLRARGLLPADTPAPTPEPAA